ncbi:head GIN domain-containing protein [Glacieibacterium frigidum]|uniref:DUF2807 domain-containing protein n=1 Tax=Glacieibacterium frigidum TaxID=2593303 RepID=A0A552UGW4_9SPHN|nr:head GIN domain-containing protein [Glacieibacterium frigidum]TRW17417.1 DUF2807 domain-containing protein [Glacieibacterium frigidum]
MIRFAALALLTATPALAAEMNVPVGSFDRLSLSGSPEVLVTTGKAVTVRASGEQKALDRLDIRVENGVLKIGTKKGNWDVTWGKYGKVRVAVTVPMLRGVDLGGSGTISVDRIKVPSFGAAVGGSGSIRVASLDAERASFEVGGSGSIDAAGRCGDTQASIGGSGSLRLGALKCATLTASIGGSGDIDAFASRAAKVSVAGSGDARIAGGAKCSVSKVGSGSVTCPA